MSDKLAEACSKASSGAQGDVMQDDLQKAIERVRRDNEGESRLVRNDVEMVCDAAARCAEAEADRHEGLRERIKARLLEAPDWYHKRDRKCGELLRDCLAALEPAATQPSAPGQCAGNRRPVNLPQPTADHVVRAVREALDGMELRTVERAIRACFAQGAGDLVHAHAGIGDGGRPELSDERAPVRE